MNSQPLVSEPGRKQLLRIAHEAIECLLTDKTPGQAQTNSPVELQRQGASFVTLNIDTRLRGCIGSLIAHRPLIEDVFENARAAASRDPRFPPLTWQEFEKVSLHLSILSAPEAIPFESRDQLLSLIRPGIDGLIVEESGRSATYLPSVWSQIPRADQFLSDLRRKAGLSPHDWSEKTKVFRYTTEEFC